MDQLYNCILFQLQPWQPPMALHHYAAAAAKSLQSCPNLCDPIDGSPSGSAVPGILQARTPEWVALSFSNAWKWKVKVKLLSRVRLLATPHGLQPTRLLHPWDFPGKSTGMGCHCLLALSFWGCYLNVITMYIIFWVWLLTLSAISLGFIPIVVCISGLSFLLLSKCSCLENPRDGGAWWASIYGVTQSRTRLKQLSSSSSNVPLHGLLHFAYPFMNWRAFGLLPIFVNYE